MVSKKEKRKQLMQILIFLGFIILIIILRMQVTGETFGPAQGAMALIGLN